MPPPSSFIMASMSASATPRPPIRFTDAPVPHTRNRIRNASPQGGLWLNSPAGSATIVGSSILVILLIISIYFIVTKGVPWWRRRRARKALCKKRQAEHRQWLQQFKHPFPPPPRLSLNLDTESIANIDLESGREENIVPNFGTYGQGTLTKQAYLQVHEGSRRPATPKPLMRNGQPLQLFKTAEAQRRPLPSSSHFADNLPLPAQEERRKVFPTVSDYVLKRGEFAPEMSSKKVEQVPDRGSFGTISTNASIGEARPVTMVRGDVTVHDTGASTRVGKKTKDEE